jgi:hypothetical protein
MEIEEEREELYASIHCPEKIMPQEMFGSIYISNDALLDLSPYQIFKPARALESMKFGRPLKRNTAQNSGRMLHETAIEEPGSLEEHTKRELAKCVATNGEHDLIQQSFPPRGNTSLDSGASDQESAVNPPKGTPISSIEPRYSARLVYHVSS